MDLTQLIESESAKLDELHAAIRRTAVDRDRGPHSRREWAAACAAFHSYVSPLDRYFEQACEQARYSHAELLEFAIRFLELDPWFFRSGYLKQILITRLKRSDLSESARERLRRVVIDAANRRGAREFKYYCRLAAVVADDKVVSELETVSTGTDAARANRAKMMLDQIRQHSQLHNKRSGA